VQQVVQQAAPPPAAPARPAQATPGADGQLWSPTPGQKTFGPSRKKVIPAITKVLLLNLDTDVQPHQVERATMDALKLPHTSASSAKLVQLRGAMNAIKRESSSELVTKARDCILATYPDFTHRNLVPAKATKSPEVIDEHQILFAQLVNAPPGFYLRDDDVFMHSFHAAADRTTGTLRAFARPEWATFIADYRTYLPAGRASEITLNLVAFLVMVLKQSLTFTPDSEGVLKRTL
jgi:hypothetical protein